MKALFDLGNWAAQQFVSHKAIQRNTKSYTLFSQEIFRLSTYRHTGIFRYKKYSNLRLILVAHNGGV